MTELAIWFQANAMPYIISFATTLAAALSVLAPIIAVVKKIRKSVRIIESANSAVVADNALLKAENANYRRKILETAIRVERIENALKIALLNDKDLVMRGYADALQEIFAGNDFEGGESDENKTKP